ncbi:hypothetical protein D3C75_1003510 [compost metagenome]
MTTMRGSMLRLALASERDRRCSGNSSGLGKAEPNGTVLGSLIESRIENTSALTSTSVDSLTGCNACGSLNWRGAWALTK